MRDRRFRTKQFRPLLLLLRRWTGRFPGRGTPHANDLGALLLQVGSGDSSAFATLYDRMAPAVWEVVRTARSDPQQAHDLAVAVFAGIWQQAPRMLSVPADPHAYLVEQARRRAADLP